MIWTDADTQAYRKEFEKRFRARTPSTRIDECDFGTRVARSEMINWSLDVLGKQPPIDRDWALTQVRWTRRMIKKIVKEQDPGDLPRLAEYWKGYKRGLNY